PAAQPQAPAAGARPLRGGGRRARGEAGAFGRDGQEAAGDPGDAGGAAPLGPVRRAGGGGPMSATEVAGQALAAGTLLVGIDGLRAKLLSLGLEYAAEVLTEELTEAALLDQPHYVVLDRLLQRELQRRDERRVKTSLKLSNLPPGMTLGNFDFGFQPAL